MGVCFRVWAPNAWKVYVVGDFNQWNPSSHSMSKNSKNGVWELFVSGIDVGTQYKYRIETKNPFEERFKTDPYVFYTEDSPNSAGIVWDLSFDWSDQEWMSLRNVIPLKHKPISIYELHVGSWRKFESCDSLYRELAKPLSDYVRDLGFTHVELLPVLEHPFYGSWGYQVSQYFAPTSRYGSPQDLMYFIDYLHQAGVGVILDWVPSHFAIDGTSLECFDGTHLYEHSHPYEKVHAQWGTYLFNYGSREVREFLISSALFWLDKYHFDGLRVDAVSSMLLRNFGRQNGKWIPNKDGGDINYEAKTFLLELNREVKKTFPDVLMIAEESSNYPSITSKK